MYICIRFQIVIDMWIEYYKSLIKYYKNIYNYSEGGLLQQRYNSENRKKGPFLPSIVGGWTFSATILKSGLFSISSCFVVSFYQLICFLDSLYITFLTKGENSREYSVMDEWSGFSIWPTWRPYKLFVPIIQFNLFWWTLYTLNFFSWPIIPLKLFERSPPRWGFRLVPSKSILASMVVCQRCRHVHLYR